LSAQRTSVMNHSKIFVNRNDRKDYLNDYVDADSNGKDFISPKTTLTVKVKPSDEDDDHENQNNRKRSLSLNSNTATNTKQRGGVLRNVIEETTTYKYLTKRPRHLSIDSSKQKTHAFPMRNTTSSNQYYNTAQTAFYPTWDEWKRQNIRKNKPKISDIEKQQTQSDDTNEQQINSVFEETSSHNKYSNNTTTGILTSNIDSKIPNQVEYDYNERMKKLDHNQKKNNEVYELKIDKQSSYNKQENQHSVPIENFSYSEKNRNEALVVGERKSEETDRQERKSYTFQDKVMQQYFDEMESRRKTLINNDSVSLTHMLSNDGPSKRNTGKVDLNMKQQQQNVKSIKSTLKRKDSFDSKNNSRTRLNDLSDSDTEIQNRLLAKASGSIPIEYISIRRDLPTPPPQTEKKTKSISVGTNTAIERGRRIASTNTEQEPLPLPAYNLHLSLDSLFTKPKREASTSTDRKKLRDAFTVTDDEAIYRVRSEKCINILPVVEHRSRRTRHEIRRSPEYRLEFLAKSPSILRKKEYHRQHHEEHKSARYNFGDEIDCSDNQSFYQRFADVNADDDDRLIFGDLRTDSKVRSGSFPVFRSPLGNLNENMVTTRRLVKQSTNTSYMPNQMQTNDMFELSSLPLIKNHGYQYGGDSLWNKQFDEMNMKFNSIFDRGHFRKKQNSMDFVEAPKTQRSARLLKY
jgi:hypothetical protein